MGGFRGGAWTLMLALSLASVCVSTVRGQNATVNGTTNSTVSPYPWCYGVEMIYQLQRVEKIFPYFPAYQPYLFEANLTVNNKGFDNVDIWGVGLSWVNREILVLVFGDSGEMRLNNGSAYPADVSQGCILTPSPAITLRNKTETAGNITQSEKPFRIRLVGTEFNNSLNPMPSSFNFTPPNYLCDIPKYYGNKTMHCCCLQIYKLD